MRKQKGFSHDQLAENLSIDTSNYGRIERRKSSISIDRIEKLARSRELIF
jgi:transcriptional regulator with XRE-family HTH domain